jgi:hypothetical protein
VTAAALTLDLDLSLADAPGPRIGASAARSTPPAAAPLRAAPGAAQRPTPPPGAPAAAQRPTAPPAAPSSRAARTLDELISGVWEGLSAHQTVVCPVCTGPMAPRYGSGARPVGGRCRRCASTLG